MTLEVATPFLVIEVKKQDTHAGELTARNQLAGAMANAHDILCSLDVQDKLYVFGIVQIAHRFTIYASYSTRKVDEVSKVVLCDSVSCCPYYVLISFTHLYRFTSWTSANAMSLTSMVL